MYQLEADVSSLSVASSHYHHWPACHCRHHDLYVYVITNMTLTLFFCLEKLLMVLNICYDTLFVIVYNM